jgi:hypothetical protein
MSSCFQQIIASLTINMTHLLHLPDPSLFLVGGAKPENAADCAYASAASEGARDVARVRVGGARLEKAADCAYASSAVCDVVPGGKYSMSFAAVVEAAEGVVAAEEVGE